MRSLESKRIYSELCDSTGESSLFFFVFGLIVNNSETILVRFFFVCFIHDGVNLVIEHYVTLFYMYINPTFANTFHYDSLSDPKPYICDKSV